MSSVFVFLLMLFCHIVDDYYLQGWLASAKQKEWWQQNAPAKLYQYDYLWALIMHSISWSFMIMLPIAIMNKFAVDGSYAVLFALNAIVHGYIDNLKANVQSINLWEDQLIHMTQIVITFMCLT